MSDRLPNPLLRIEGEPGNESQADPLLELATSSPEEEVLSLIMATKNAGWWEAWSKEYEGAEAMPLLDAVHELLRSFQNQVQDNPEMLIFALYNLDKQLAAVSDTEMGQFSGCHTFLECFRRSILQHFEPLPSVSDMELFGKAFEDLLNTKFGSKQQTFHKWGRAKRKSNAFFYKELHTEAASDEPEFLKKLEMDLQKLKKPFDKFIALRWFINGLVRSVDDGNYTFLGIKDLMDMPKYWTDLRVCWSWTAVGCIADSLIRYETLKPGHFVYGPSSGAFLKIRNEIAPWYTTKMARYKGLLATRQHKVEDLKASIFRGLMTALASAASFSMRGMYHAVQHHPMSNSTGVQL